MWTRSFQQTQVGLSRGFEGMHKVASQRPEQEVNGERVEAQEVGSRG